MDRIRPAFPNIDRNTLRGCMKRWAGDWGGKLTIGFVLFIAFSILYLSYYGGDPENKALISNMIALIGFSVPSILAWRASRHADVSKRTVLAWCLVALAHGASIVGTTLWIYFENYLGVQPFPSWADAGYLAYYPLMMAGLLLLVEKMRSAEERISFALDSSVILVGGGVVIWYFLLRPISQASDGDTLTTILSLAYPIGDLVLLLGISSLLLRRAAIASRGVVNLLLFGVVLNFCGDFIFGYQSIAGTYETGNAVDSLYTLAVLPIGLAAHMQYVTAGDVQAEASIRDDSTARFFWVPYIAVAVVYFVLLIVAFEHKEELIEYVIAVAGCVTGLVIVRQFMFVRETVKAGIALNEMQQRIQGIYSASTDAIGLADFSGTMTEVNDSFVSLTGHSREEIVGTMNYHDFVADDYLDMSITPEIARESGRPIEYERVLIRKDMEARNVSTTLYSVTGRHGTPAAMAVVIRDITDRRSLERQLTHQALHDPLTGLANRALLLDRVTAALKRSRRHNTRIALLFLDLDNFKTVNDTLGHAAGDTLLITVAERLRTCLRASDTAARLGGDEFALLIEDITIPGEEITVAKRIIQSIRMPVAIDGKEAFVGASIGIALGSESIEQHDLLRNADVAMYASKKQGKNRYTVFEEGMHAAVIHHAQLQTELRAAIDKKEFQVWYQPIIDLADSKVVAVEALLRWDHPRKIDIGPSEFIPIAEEANLIGELGQFAIEEACGQAARWHESFCPVNPFALSVNISGRQFMDVHFVDTVRAACMKTGLSPRNLILEITESTMLVNGESTIERLAEIRDLGVKLAVDDFGTGYSSLSYLHKFPIDVLKIDRSFVEKINKDEEGSAMVNAILSMSTTLRFTTIAEGIETLDQVDTLRGLGCSWGQGYYYAKPLTTEQMAEFLSRSFTETHLSVSQKPGLIDLIGPQRLRSVTT